MRVMQAREVTMPDTTLTWDLNEMTLDSAHALVRLTEWHATIPAEVFARAATHSLCVGLRVPSPVADWPHRLVAFARVVTDRATYGYLCDVVVHPGWRGRGLARRLLVAVHAHPDIASLRRFSLLSREAPGLYRKLGWVDLDPSVTYLERGRAVYHRGWAPGDGEGGAPVVPGETPG